MRTTWKAGAIAGLALSLFAIAPAGATPKGGPPASAGNRLVVNTVADTPDAKPDGRCADAAGLCSLRAAVQTANERNGLVTIDVPEGAYALTGEDLDVTRRVRILATGAVIQPSGIRAFDVVPGGDLALHGATITGGIADDGGVLGNSGGAILNQGTLLVDGVTITENAAVRAGGAIEATAGSRTTILRSVLSDNDTGGTPGNGGAFHLTGAGTVDIVDSEITGNSAQNEGGGVWNSNAGTMTISGTLIEGNTAAGNGARNGGGGVFQQGIVEGGPSTGTIAISGSTIRDNHATGTAGSGGGILNVEGVVTVVDTLIEGNTAPRAGGGIEIAGSDVAADRVELTRVTLVDNTTGANPGNGGGLHLTGPGTVLVDDSVVTGNDAANEGGGLWNSIAGTMTVTDTVIAGNTAPTGPNVFQQGAVAGGFTVDGQVVPTGQNTLVFS